MNTMTPSVILLLLITGIFADVTEQPRQPIGEDDTDGDDSQTNPPTVSPSCDCSLMTFDADELQGTIKSPGYPDEYCNHLNCVYEIEAHPTRATILTVDVDTLDMERHDHLYIYFVGVLYDRKEKILVSDLARRETLRFVAPPKIGLLLQLITDESVPGRFLLEYERVDGGLHLGDGDPLVCPYPFIYVDSTVRTIKVDDWAKIGCAIRLTSNASIEIRAKCDYTYDNGMYIRASLPGEVSEYWSLTVNDLTKQKSTSSADIAIIGSSSYYGRRRNLDKCQITFYSLDYDPCNCSRTSYELVANKPLNISSPGFPTMLCTDIACFYHFTRANLTSPYKNGFKVTAIHFTEDYEDKLDFSDGKHTKILQLNHDTRGQIAEEIFIGDKLQMDYSAPIGYSNLHGFTLQIEAINVMSDCICPSNIPKALPMTGTYSMTIPAYCGDMKCRFRIPPASSYYKTNFRMTLNYKFFGENENIDVETDEVTATYSGEYDKMTLRRHTAMTDKYVRVTYRRQGIYTNKSAIGQSTFNITWKWLSRTQCACERNPFKADIDHWDELYSPRYPEEYCLNMNCVYLIQAPVGYHVLMNVTFFETEPHSDFLFFFDSFDNLSSHILELHGHVITAPLFESTTRNASLQFLSDGSITAKGFVVAYKAVKDSVEETPTEGGWLGIVLGVLVAVLLVAGAAGGVLLAYKKKILSFKNPSFTPPVEYHSNGEEGEATIFG